MIRTIHTQMQGAGALCFLRARLGEAMGEACILPGMTSFQ